MDDDTVRHDRFTTWLARRVMVLAGWIDPRLHNPPTVEAEMRMQLLRTRFELLHAEEQRERWHFTCEMLKARISRLTPPAVPPAPAAPPAPFDWPENAGKGPPLTSRVRP